MSYITNIIREVEDNTNFRTVLFTGGKSQLVLMDIPEGGEIGSETHAHVEQTIFIHQGNAKSILDGSETEVGPGHVVVVSPGVMHNIVNTGTGSLKVYTVYAPANHIEGRVHTTKAEADADSADEAFGEQVR